MRTKNFRQYSCAVLSSTQRRNDEKRGDDYTYDRSYFTVVSVSGKKQNNSIDTSSYVYAQILSGCLIVGTGTTPPTEDDYKLENKVDLKLVNQSVILSPPNLVIVGTFENNTSEAVTITEVAYRLQQRHDSSDDNNDFIVSRDLITPITIPAGERRTIQYTMEF